MKKYLCLIAIILFFVLINANANFFNANDSWIKISEPEPGIYFNGEKIIPSRIYVFIGENIIDVSANASNNIFTAYFFLYDIMKKDLVEGIWDGNALDGFSCEFSLNTGVYAIAVAGFALDTEEPVAIDWITPVIVFV